MIVCGVDGCKRGWYAVLLAGDMDELEIIACEVRPSFQEILCFAREAAAIAVDVPIGLSSNGARECDRVARRMLGRPRASSVFPAPLRPALAASSYEKAGAVTRRLSGKGISRQSWAIFPKVREVDGALSPELQERVVEVHPELCFWALQNGRPMDHKKTAREGQNDRTRLLARVLGGGASMAGLLRPPVGVARDDVLDALVAACTAAQLAAGRARRILDAPARDARGLRMEMVIPMAPSG